MTIAYVSAGAVAKQNGDSSPATVAYPATTTNGNMLLLAVPTGSPGNAAPTTPTDWELVGTALSGAGSYTTSSGARRETVYWKIADGTEGGNTLSLAWDSGGGGATLGAQIHQFSKTEADWEDPVFASGDDTSSGAGSGAFSVVTGALALDAGDLVFVAPAVAGDPLVDALAVSAASITFGTVTDRPSPDNTGRISWCLSSVPVTAGTASGAVTMTWDLSGDASTGVALAVRLREIAGGGGSVQPPRSMNQYRLRRAA